MNTDDRRVVDLVRRTFRERAADMDGVVAQPLAATPAAVVFHGRPGRAGPEAWLRVATVTASVLVVAVAAALVVARPGGGGGAREARPVQVVGSASTGSVPVHASLALGPATTAPLVRSPAERPAVAPTPAPTPLPPVVAPAVGADSAGPDVPLGFVPRSVTFATAQLGWALGTGKCSEPPCTVLLRTSDGGRTWQNGPAPRSPVVTAAPYGPGVSRVRFAADGVNGWLFGPDLFSTHDGGATWAPVPLPGGQPYLTRVVAVESGPRVAYAAVDLGKGSQLFRSDVGADRWAPVAAVTLAPDTEFDRVVVVGQAVWVTANAPSTPTAPAGSPTFFSADGSAWELPPELPCPPPSGPAAVSGTGNELSVVCPGGGGLGSQAKSVYVSHDGGRKFERVSDAPFGGSFLAAVQPSASTVVVAAVSGGSFLYATFDGGRTWSTVLEALETGGVPWYDLRFVTPEKGSVLEGDTGRLYLTEDGGRSWSPSTF